MTVQTEVVTDIMTKVVARSIQNCASFADIKQELRIENTSYAVIEGVVMDQKFSVQIKCNQDQAQIAKLQNEITNQIMQSSTQITQGVLGAVNALVGEENDQNLETKVNTVLKNDVTAELIQKITNEVNAVQSFVLKDVDHIVVKDVAMKQVNDAILDITQRNIQQTSIVNAVQNHTSQKAKQEMRNPIADSIDAVGRAGKNLLDGMGNLLSGQLMTVILVLVILVVMGLIAQKIFGGSDQVQYEQQPESEQLFA